MFDVTLSSGDLVAGAACLLLAIMGKISGNETRLYTLALVGAVLGGSFESVLLAMLAHYITAFYEIVRKVW